ncbi:MAG: Phenylalanine--tRNA ligase alpha subunit [Chlamydiae bacterium]|nr:Phenylalanine--tRNA ligase alpha subunit [Chlamydiota bacterium]
MDLEIKELKQSFSHALKKAKTLKDFTDLKVKFFGKKGPIQALFLILKDIPQDKRPLVGKELNDLRSLLQEKLDVKLQDLEVKEALKQINQEKLDVTLPSRKKIIGNMHPISKFLDQVLDVFQSMGFSVQIGPDIESDFYNFEALNFAPDHPARDMQDTFYINDEYLLRTHTSNAQVRFMQTHTPPFKICVPGKAYRNEDISVRSHVLFHQIEAFYVDTHVSFQDLLATLNVFFEKLFGDVKVRFRPSYFPFVEPGLEADISCLICNQKGCRICKQTGWLEILGAGLIHPKVLENSGIDSEKYSGYAWGMGVERLLMILNGIQDIRLFLENDMQFLSQFA